ncbi:MAG: CobW family GTP-binding protein [Burkholderiaceae bacterium]
MSTHVPVTILTGFLGSGKTTLLNRVLNENHGMKIAVIENEFGAEGVDNELLTQSADEQIIEMNNGCICCTVRGDLIRILADLRTKRDAGELNFDRVVIETTGMADPAPVAQTFFIDDEIAEYFLLDAVLTVIDAKHGNQQLDDNREAQEQVAFADRLLMSKVDVATEQEQDELRKRLVRLNPRARIMPVHFGEVDVKEVLDIRGFNLNAILDIDPDFLEDNEHEHSEEIASFVFRAKKPFDPGKLEDFLSGLIQVYGESMLRYKGVLYMKGSDRQTVFQGVHMMMGADVGRKWRADEKKSSKMVFIGRNLPKETFIKGLEQCLA